MYELGALVFHLFLLCVLMLVAPDGRALDDREILVPPAVLGELRVNFILCAVPKVAMQSLELRKVQLVLSSCDVIPNVLSIARMEPIPKEFREDLLEAIKINGFS